MSSTGARPEPRLRLLADVMWDGVAVTGGRAHAVLAALADAEGRVLGESLLVESVWGADHAPANPGKALQVVVSRVRAQTHPKVVERVGGGYRLGVDPALVDALALRRAVSLARTATARGDWTSGRDAAREALAGPVPAGGPAGGPLEELRVEAARSRETVAVLLARCLSALGEHHEALALLEAAVEREAPEAADEATSVALLRSLAAVRGTATALERYEALRRRLADRLGVDPGPALRELHAELLAADRPVRSGLRHAATPLVGREADLRALRAAVREARVVSIVGPGGLGKTRLAFLLAREAEQPAVHVVELVGVTAAEDVLGEVGSVLGVRDSVSTRRVRPASAPAEVRARLAETLAVAPTLLVLDNCEHVVGAVADLVAFLVASCPRLHVLTTTRAPLSIAAERVFPLAQLDEPAATELFRQRALAARPGADLPAEAVREVVARLDGLPLAVELAAAQVRAMSVGEVSRRLEDRFALLRGGDRSAPDRHRTLSAVIEWSWDLLDEPARRALCRLSVFHDGFSLDGAEALLGPGALDLVRVLVDQSLLAVLETRGALRYRMLETVREFGRLRLGQDTDAVRAWQAWACAVADHATARLWTRDQVAAVRALAPEEGNLADCLRAALARPDPAVVAHLVAALGTYWTLRGENLRVIGLVREVDAALEGWTPRPEDVRAAVTAASIVVLNSVVGGGQAAPASRALVTEHGAADHRLGAVVAVLGALDQADPDVGAARLASLAEGPGREAAALARMWTAHHRENSGDPAAAVREAEAGLALTREEDGPWLAALLHTFLGAVLGQLGRHDLAVGHALAALPVLDALEADDDAVQCRSLVAMHAIREGRFAEAERRIEEIEEIGSRRRGFGALFVTATTRAELLLARGHRSEGLASYRRAVAELSRIRMPFAAPDDLGGIEPWTLFAQSAAVTAHAVHGEGEDGVDLYTDLLGKAPRVLVPDRPHLDVPVAGLVLHGLGAWALLRSPAPTELAVRLLVVGDAFGYPQSGPTLSPALTAEAAEEREPGLLARLRAEYAGATVPELLDRSRAVVARLADAYILRE